MIKVELSFRELNLEKTLTEKRPVYDTVTAKHIVASTKSYNNLIEDYKAENKSTSGASTRNLFIDKKATEIALAELVANEGVEMEYQSLVVEHMLKALDGACVFKRPPVVKK